MGEFKDFDFGPNCLENDRLDFPENECIIENAKNEKHQNVNENLLVTEFDVASLYPSLRDVDTSMFSSRICIAF